MFSAQAATFTFGLSLDGEANAFQSVDGIGLTVENASIVGLGAGLFVSTVDGIVLSDSAAGNVQSFDLVFDTDVYINSFSIGSVLNGGGTIGLSVAGGSTISGLDASIVQTVNLGSPILVTSGTSVTLSTAGYGAAAISNLADITVEAVPEPAQASVLLGTAAVLILLGRRRIRR